MFLAYTHVCLVAERRGTQMRPSGVYAVMCTPNVATPNSPQAARSSLKAMYEPCAFAEYTA